KDWIPLGVTPLSSVKVPFGSLRWQLTKAGYEPLEVAGAGHEIGTFTLAPVATAGRQMVSVPRGGVELDTGSTDVPDYWIDKFEVTNREFRQFVDAGGYRTRDYWREPFVKDGHPIDWEHAIAELHDATGRPGPSTWEIGAFPEGQDD